MKRTLCSFAPRLALPRPQTGGLRRQIVQMLADGFSTRRGRRGAYLHRDRVNSKLRGRRGAKLIAVTNGGAIPDQFDYDVILSPSGLRIGIPQRRFLLREHSRRHLPTRQHQLPHPEGGDGKGAGGRRQGPAAQHPLLVRRSPGQEHEISARLAPAGRRRPAACRWRRADGWLTTEIGLEAAAAQQLARISRAANAALRQRCPPRTRWCSSASSTRRGISTSSSIRLSARASTAPGASPCASASAASSTSNYKPRHWKTPSSCLWARPTVPAGGAGQISQFRHSPGDLDPSGPGRAHVWHPLALGGYHGSRGAAQPQRQAQSAGIPASGCGRPGGGGVPGSTGLRREPGRCRGKCRTIRWCIRP